ncbi:hypothetical protein KCH_06140 [Kitasatospora cheerisanensis KCTC 2395]|uniref:Uncharacterized protein n=1 Tax=Kitasatospora cheerisanensis KCTC 2395 TaxID=1348663 RepID=A0A066ZBB8_9ACTN|nr:hypothetical protein KCH_06140 [Kitasatospora cheerisanensis KCTC 2395]
MTATATPVAVRTDFRDAGALYDLSLPFLRSGALRPRTLDDYRHTPTPSSSSAGPPASTPARPCATSPPPRPPAHRRPAQPLRPRRPPGPRPRLPPDRRRPRPRPPHRPPHRPRRHHRRRDPLRPARLRPDPPDRRAPGLGRRTRPGPRLPRLPPPALTSPAQVAAPDQRLPVRPVPVAVELRLVEPHPVRQLALPGVLVVDGLGGAQLIDGAPELPLPRPPARRITDHRDPGAGRQCPGRPVVSSHPTSVP